MTVKGCTPDGCSLAQQCLQPQAKALTEEKLTSVCGRGCRWCQLTDGRQHKEPGMLCEFGKCVCAQVAQVMSDSDPMDYSPQGYPVHGILQARILEWVAISFSRRIFPTQVSNPHLLHLLHCRRILYHLSHQRSQERAQLGKWGMQGPGRGDAAGMDSSMSVDPLLNQETMPSSPHQVKGHR